MEWIKVTVRHAEYDFVGAPDNVFRAWVMSMILTAAIEKIPDEKRLENKLGKDNYMALKNHLKENGILLVNILKKVLEDVEVVKHKRKHSRKYMEEYRCNAQRGGQQAVMLNAKIREDKRREDKTTLSEDERKKLHKDLMDVKNKIADSKKVCV